MFLERKPEPKEEKWNNPPLELQTSKQITKRKDSAPPINFPRQQAPFAPNEQREIEHRTEENKKKQERTKSVPRWPQHV